MNKSSEEKRQHSSQLIPYSYYKCRIPEYFASVPLHWHGEFEINYILSGCGEFLCADEHFIAHSGDIVILPPNIIHSIRLHEAHSMRYDTIVFSPELLGSSDNDRCACEFIRPLVSGTLGMIYHLTKDHPYYTELVITVENIFSCAKGNSPQLDMLMRSELLRLLWLMENNGDIFRKAETDTRSETLRPVLQYIKESFREELSVEMLAKQAHLSPSYFMGLFKRTAGMSAIEYINHMRIKAACDILLSSEKTIAETAYECGFRNLSNFNKQFRRIAGCTPAEYRQLNRN